MVDDVSALKKVQSDTLIMADSDDMTGGKAVAPMPGTWPGGGDRRSRRGNQDRGATLLTLIRTLGLVRGGNRTK